jgi:hypothetical protein
LTIKDTPSTKVPVRARPVRSVIPINVAKGQEHANWCWAACSQSVLDLRGQRVSQGALADDVPRLGGHCTLLPLPVPCDDGVTSAELTALLSRRLPTVVNAGVLSEAELTAELTSVPPRPVIIAFDWGHAGVVYGTSGNKFLFYDPLGPTIGEQSFSALNSYGPGAQTWSESWKGL